MSRPFQNPFNFSKLNVIKEEKEEDLEKDEKKEEKKEIKKLKKEKKKKEEKEDKEETFLCPIYDCPSKRKYNTQELPNHIRKCHTQQKGLIGKMNKYNKESTILHNTAFNIFKIEDEINNEFIINRHPSIQLFMKNRDYNRKLLNRIPKMEDEEKK